MTDKLEIFPPVSISPVFKSSHFFADEGRGLCYSPTGELLLSGYNLFDPRAPRLLHSFEAFSGVSGGSAFHPAGQEAIINSEVVPLFFEFTFLGQAS